MSDNVIEFPLNKRKYQMEDKSKSRIRTCCECHRKFNMSNEDDAAEWHYGHDCEFK